MIFTMSRHLKGRHTALGSAHMAEELVSYCRHSSGGEVSLFQGLKNTQTWYLGVLISGVEKYTNMVLGCPYKGFHCIAMSYGVPFVSKFKKSEHYKDWSDI